MLVALHRTLSDFLTGSAPTGSLLEHATIDFSVPDAEFRGALTGLTLNLYLHELRENLEMRRAGGVIRRNADGSRSSRVRSPGLLNCGYCITAWSTSERDSGPVFEEHRLLSEVLTVLMKHQRIPEAYWRDGLGDQMAPYPMIVAQPDALSNQAELWTALGHPPKPILTYVVTVAVALHDDGELGHPVGPIDDSLSLDLINDRPAAEETRT